VFKVLPARTEKQKKRKRSKTFETSNTGEETRKGEVIIKTYSKLERAPSLYSLGEQKDRGFLVADKVSCSLPIAQVKLITGSFIVVAARLSRGRQSVSQSVSQSDSQTC
jgi:hypothetical protein